MLHLRADPAGGEFDVGPGGFDIPPGMSPTQSLLRLRCPGCREGDVFAGAFRMHETCAECGVRFEREQGYFLGAMYMSYGLGLIEVTPLVLALVLLGVGYGWILVATGLLLAASSSWLFRYGRILWLHMDHACDPPVSDRS